MVINLRGPQRATLQHHANTRVAVRQTCFKIIPDSVGINKLIQIEEDATKLDQRGHVTFM